jgi:hypothetical protein
LRLLDNNLTSGNNISENDLQTKIDNLSKQKVERVKSFREYAFEKAGLNRGDYLSLKANLQWIKDGHLVDETYNENEEQLLKQQVRNKIVSKEHEKEKIEGEKRIAVEVSKPSIEKKIKELTDEVQQTKIDLENNKILMGVWIYLENPKRIDCTLIPEFKSVTTSYS